MKKLSQQNHRFNNKRSTDGFLKKKAREQLKKLRNLAANLARQLDADLVDVEEVEEPLDAINSR